MSEIEQPTLNEAIKHIKENGGCFKGIGGGKVRWREAVEVCYLENMSAEAIVREA